MVNFPLERLCQPWNSIFVLHQEVQMFLHLLIYNCDLKTWKKKLKNGTLKFWKPWICKDEKKTSTSPFTYCWKWFRNWIPFIHTSESQIQQLQAFFLKAITVTWNVTANELRSLSFFWKIPLQTFRIQSCMYRSEKGFGVCIPRLKTKKEEWKVVCNDCIPLCPHSATYFNLKQKFLLTICICALTAKFSIKKCSKWNSI